MFDNSFHKNEIEQDTEDSDSSSTNNNIKKLGDYLYAVQDIKEVIDVMIKRIREMSMIENQLKDSVIKLAEQNHTLATDSIEQAKQITELAKSHSAQYKILMEVKAEVWRLQKK